MAGRVRPYVKRLRDAARALSYRGKGRYCPVCGKSSRRFRGFGIVVREDAQCVRCGSLERHRLLWLFVQAKTDLFDGTPKRMLHVAPEPCLESRFRSRLGDGYVTADLFDPRAMVRMDITDIPFEDESFDVIYCSHVLEHVTEDRRAMREFVRVLKRDGWAILLVPVYDGETLEDVSVVDPEERIELFGQDDHVRRYGRRDYVERLRDAGFTVGISQVTDLTSPDEAVRMGLTSASGEIHFCTK